MRREYFGTGCISALKTILAKEKPKHIFLVTGDTSYTLSGAKDAVKTYLGPYHVVQFSDFSNNPNYHDVKKGITLFRRQKCDITISIGGGSVIDMAKAITVLSAQEKNPQLYIQNKLSISHKGIPMVAIPTTAGTGSEATHFAVIYIRKTKYSLAHKAYMLPDYAILDPTLTYTLPSNITATTGMDALAQAIEAYWSVRSTKQSKIYAKKAISLILANIEIAVQKPTSGSRVSMMQGANFAGKAINIAFTTACHAISYPMTAYFAIPHGHAVALTLGEMFLFNAATTDNDCLDARGAGYVQKNMAGLVHLFRTKSVLGVHARIQQIMDAIGLERSLGMLKVTGAKNINLIINNSFQNNRLKNNPRKISESSLSKILHHIA